MKTKYYNIKFKDSSTCVGYFIGNNLYDTEGFALNENLINWIE